MFPGPAILLALGINEITSRCGCCSWGHTSDGWPGKGITLPGKDQGLTGVSCHGTCENASSVLASSLSGIPRPFPCQLASRAWLVTG